MFEAKELCKSYAGHLALPPVSFCLPAGQCMGIVGPNGSGKSTLLRLLAQIQRPDSGDVLFERRSVLGDKRFLRSRVGYVPQEDGLMTGLTARRQLRLWQSACGVRGPIPDEIMELMGLAPLLPLRIEALSGGMRRRVSIAMALLNAPDILLMDEATSGLDEAWRLRLLDWVEGYLARGGRVIWCSHHRDELDRLCGGLLHLDRARL